MQYCKLYIDFDTLFDTRLAVVNQLNPAAANRIMSGTDYWEREHTDWPKLTQGLIKQEVFEKAWEQRDNITLKNSVMTAIIPVVTNMLLNYQQSKDAGVNHEEIGLEINIHPYTFSSEEMDELTNILTGELFYSELNVTYIDISLEELTPSYIQKHYSGMVFFEFHRWIKLHANMIQKAKCNGIPMVVPKLFDINPMSLSVEKRKEEIVSFKLWLLDHLRLEFIDARWFSLFRPELS